MKPDVRKVLMEQAAPYAGKRVAVLLSAGIDSASVLFSLIEAGAEPHAYSFTLDGRLSSDFSAAKRNAATFGVPFTGIFLPVDVETLKRDMLDLLGLGARKKTDFECGWPMLYAYKAVEEVAVFSGMGADGHFCLSKKGMIHFRHRIDEFRQGLYRSATYAQQHIHRRLGKRHGKVPVMPYITPEMQAEFIGTTWNEVNRPKQKVPILRAFPERFARMRVEPHTNLQLGDSGIAEHFRLLLKTDWNVSGSVSVVGIYNALVAGKIK